MTAPGPLSGAGAQPAFLPPVAEREDFMAAQRRHRRAARAYAMLSAVAIGLQGLPFGLLVSPLLIGAAVLLLDVVNLVSPVPDPFVWVTGLLARFDDVALVVLAAPALLLPGALWLVTLWWVVRRRVLRTGGGSVLLTLGAREPQGDLAERQLVNLVEEMAIAAGIQPPSVLVLDSDVINAAAVGTAVDDATVVVTRGLLDACSRAETQAVAGHLIAVIGNGDLRIGHGVLAFLVTYNLARALLLWPFDRGSRRMLRPVWQAVSGDADPHAEAAAIEALMSRFLAEDQDIHPLLGLPAMIVDLAWGVLQFISNLFVVGPLLALPWRRRRYLADATAVQLTRLPDALARALGRLQGRDIVVPGAQHTAPLFIAGTETMSSTVFGDALGISAPLHPPLHKRLDRLHRMGATVPDTGAARHTWRHAGAYVVFALVASPLLIAIFCLVCALIYLCVLLGLMVIGFVFFITVVPAHVFLRGL